RVVVGERSAQRLQDILRAELLVLPFIDHRVFEVQHYARGAGVQHFHHKFRFVGGAGHLIALVEAPVRQFDSPVAAGHRRRKEMRGLVAAQRFFERFAARFQESAMTRRKSAVQRREKIQKTRGQVALACARWSAIDVKSANFRLRQAFGKRCGGHVRSSVQAACAAGLAAGTGSVNWAVSVEPWSAMVEAVPPEMICCTSSKYPVPTKRWCFTAP